MNYDILSNNKHYPRKVKITQTQTSKVFFTSDTHFGHKNVIQYDGRPFSSVEEMDNVLISNWNNTVGQNDVVFFLGDFSFEKESSLVELVMSQLNGKKYFIRGNHDHTEKTICVYEKYGVYLGEQKDIVVDGQRIVLNHYPMLVWNQSHRGAWALHGHCHGSLPDDPNALRLDVGCNVWDYKPVSFDTIKEAMSKKSFKPLDHHI